MFSVSRSRVITAICIETTDIMILFLTSINLSPCPALELDLSLINKYHKPQDDLVRNNCQSTSADTGKVQPILNL